MYIAAGYTGVEIENAPSGTAYHTTRDRADAVSPRQVQAFGTTMERSVHPFGGLDLSKAERTKDLASFSAPLAGIMAHPAWLTPAVAILAVVALVVLALLAWRRRQFSLVRTLLGALALLAAAVANGVEVILAVERQPYDILFMDVQMPEMDGLEATRQICERWGSGERPRIVAMTANAMREDREACLAAGMDDYLAKPIRVEELVAALSTVRSAAA